MTRLALAVGAVLLLAPSAQAVPAWLPPAPIPGEAAPAREPRVAVAADGTVVVVWHAGAGGTQRIQTATRPPGGAFGPVDTLAGPSPVVGGPRVAVDAQGTTLVTWGDGAGARYAVRPPGGPFGPGVQVPRPAGENVSSSVEVAFDAQGNALAAWVGTQPRPGGGVDWRMRAAIRAPGGSFGAPAALDEGFDNADALGTPFYSLSSVNVASAGAGDLIASWMRLCCAVGTVEASVRAAVRPADGPFGPTQTLDSVPSDVATNLFTPRLAGSGQGSAVVAWGKQLAAGSGNVSACTRPPGGSFAGCTLENVSGTGTLPASPDVGLDGQGNAVATWSRPQPAAGDPHVIQAAGRAAGVSTWTPLATWAEPPNTLTQPELAASPQGAAAVAWRRGNSRIDGAARPAGGAFGPRQPLSASGGNPVFPDLAMDPDGNGAAAWQRGALPDTLVEVAGYDGAGPRLNALSIPAEGATGQPVSFGVVPTDVWSPVQSVGWSFGDGAVASGGAVTHTYAGVGGTFAVGVTATDSLGNATRASSVTRVRDGIRPILSRLRMALRRFAVGRRATRLVAGRVRRGSAFRFRLSEPATVRIRIERTRRGRYRRVAVLTRRGRPAGANAVKFSGRIKRRPLRPGAYRATLRAVDPSGNRSAARRTKFRILRRR